MFSKLFTTTLQHRLFDPMPLPKRVRVVAFNRQQGGRRSCNLDFSCQVRRMPKYR